MLLDPDPESTSLTRIWIQIQGDVLLRIRIRNSATHINLYDINNLCSRDSYGNFLSRLETVFGVSQQGVKIIAQEMCELSNRVLSHCMRSVTEHLGKFNLNIIVANLKQNSDTEPNPYLNPDSITGFESGSESGSKTGKNLFF